MTRDVLRLVDLFRGNGFAVAAVVITQYAGQPAADVFRNRLNALGIPAKLHYPIGGYPHDVDLIVSDDGYGKNEFVETTRPLVVVTAPGPGSGKLATCLSQLYHEHKHGTAAATPSSRLSRSGICPHASVNIAYEAATADLDDANIIDSFHLEAYNKTTVNYNRDVEAFPVVRALMEKILGKSPIRVLRTWASIWSALPSPMTMPAATLPRWRSSAATLPRSKMCAVPAWAMSKSTVSRLL